jgi:hypothetical protein
MNHGHDKLRVFHHAHALTKAIYKRQLQSLATEMEMVLIEVLETQSRVTPGDRSP